MTAPVLRVVLRRLGLPTTLVLLLACGESPTETPRVEAVVHFAKGGGGPSVDAADPNEGPQGVTLDVRVLGSGFDKGSRAEWLLQGASVAEVATNSTTYVSRSELRANITIDAAAVEAFYDIRVTTSRGKKGVGSEMFSVTKCDDPPCDGNGGATGEYTVAFAGDMTGQGISPEEKISSNGIHVNDFGDVTIHNGILSNIPNADYCFGVGAEAGADLTFVDVDLGINWERKKPLQKAGVVIHFDALSNDGLGTPTSYHLEMGWGTIADPDDWIPTIEDQPNFVTGFPQWTLTARNRNGGGNQPACVGTGNFVDNLVATVTRTR